MVVQEVQEDENEDVGGREVEVVVAVALWWWWWKEEGGVGERMRTRRGERQDWGARERKRERMRYRRY